jgi:hypothetical protein
MTPSDAINELRTFLWGHNTSSRVDEAMIVLTRLVEKSQNKPVESHLSYLDRKSKR